MVRLEGHPGLADGVWFGWLAGSLTLPLTDTAFRNLGLAVLAAVLAVTSEPTAIIAAPLSRPSTAGRSALAAPLSAQQRRSPAGWRPEIRRSSLLPTTL